MLIRIAIAAWMVASGATPSPEWARLARHLSGESDAIRADALQKISQIPELDRKLQAALEIPADQLFSAERALALDVALALHRKTLLPVLWKTEARDTTGGALLAALALDGTDSDPWTEDSTVLKDRLFGIALDRDAALGRRLVALDALGRVGWRWLPRHARALYKDRLEIQLAWLGALRARLFKEGDSEDLALLEPAFDSAEPEIRARATSIAAELTRAGARRLRAALKRCPDAACQKLLREL